MASKILVIDDESVLREEVIEWLSMEGYEAYGAGDGESGLQLALQRVPDLIVCDISMPGLDGYGVLLELHANPTTADVPFIFVTARAAQEDITRGMALGADDYVTKPFTRLELLNAIHKRLARSSAMRDNLFSEIAQLQEALGQQQQRLMLKSRLVAMFAHDFRNPLTTILSSATFVRDYADRIDPPRRQTHLNRIEASVRQLLLMLEDVMLIAKLETDNLRFEPEPLALDPFFASIVDEFRVMHGETHVLVFEGRFSHTVNADARLLRQISTNLISNAIKYSPQGGEVRVLLAAADGHWSLSVRDSGRGISEDDMARLFQAFQRGTNVSDIPGTGLGLTIVKQAVELHGGTIHLESQLGEGTLVTVTFPVAEVAPSVN